MKKFKRFFKRVGDVLLAAVLVLACIVLCIVFLVICLGVWLINLVLKPFGKKINFDPFAESIEPDYDYAW